MQSSRHCEDDLECEVAIKILKDKIVCPGSNEKLLIASAVLSRPIIFLCDT